MKALVISHNSFSKTSNNGKTLEAIFSEFPRGCLAQLYFSQNEKPDFDYCDKYFSITDLNVLRSLFTLSSSCGGPVDRHTELHSNKLSKKSFSVLKKLFKNSKFIRDTLWITNRWKSNELRHWVHEFSPDFIFFLGGDAVFSHKIAQWVKKELDIPLVVYFTDDYILNTNPINFFDRFNHFVLCRAYKRTVLSSQLLYAIGEQMAFEYSMHFGRSFGYIINCVDYQDYTLPNTNKPFLVSYFGGLHLGRCNMLIRFSKILPPWCVLQVFTSTFVSKEVSESFISAGIVNRGFLASEQLPEAMKNSHLLLHVESDEPRFSALTSLSISTKIPEYLISGRPVIGFGPPWLASMQFLIKNKIGFFLNSTEPLVNQRKSLKRILGTDFLLKIGFSGYEFALKNLLRKQVAQSFRNDIFSFLKGRHV